MCFITPQGVTILPFTFTPNFDFFKKVNGIRFNGKF